MCIKPKSYRSNLGLSFRIPPVFPTEHTNQRNISLLHTYIFKGNQEYKLFIPDIHMTTILAIKTNTGLDAVVLAADCQITTTDEDEKQLSRGLRKNCSI